jgi:hypothetical protein
MLTAHNCSCKFVSMCYDILALFCNLSFYNSIHSSCCACSALCFCFLSFLLCFSLTFQFVNYTAFKWCLKCKACQMVDCLPDASLHSLRLLKNCWQATSWCCLNQLCHQSHFQNKHDSYFL